MTIVILAIGLLAVCLPLSLLVRHKPEQYGYQPDGETESTVVFDNSLTQAKIDEVNVGTRQALKTRTFWHITLALLCQAMMLSAVVTHVMPYLSSIGIARATSSLVAMAIPLTSIGGRLGLGWLGDRLDKRRVIAAAFAMICGGLLCFGFASPEAIWLLVLFLILFGIGYGGNNTLRGSVIREFFGRSNFGAIHGIVLGIMMLGNIAAPPLAAWVFERWGSYQPIWFAFVGLAAAAILLAVTTPQVSSTAQPVDDTGP
jgi:MFS family permease